MLPSLRLCLSAAAFFATAVAPLQAQEAPPVPAKPVISPPAATEDPRDPNLPTLWVAGDSTAARDTGETKQGWAVPLAAYFDPARINVVNRARGGRSSRTFITEGLWDQLMAGVKRGDIVLIQFGHNDAGALNDEPPPPLRARGSLPGLGGETREIDNVLTKRHEVVHTYGWYMRRMVDEAKAKGAQPIIVSLTVRDIWKDGRVERDSGHYATWSAEVARTAGIPFIDANSMVADWFDRMGRQKVHTLYPKDHTHFNTPGAEIHASAVVSGLNGLPDRPVAQALSAKGQGVAAEIAARISGKPSIP